MEKVLVRHWSSRVGFLLATIGVTVGLGNLWRFPYIAGFNGGGAFVVLYILFVAAIGIPMIMAEMTLGRRGHGSPVLTMKRLVIERGSSRFWHSIGYLSALVPFLGLAYYAVVAGWSFDYIATALMGGFDGLDAESSNQAFVELVSNPVKIYLLNIAILVLTALVVGRGLQKGIERATKIMMPGLFLILLVLVAYAVIKADIGRGLDFLFNPDFSQLRPTSVMMALGQAFFSIAVGVGALITYSAYIEDDVSLPRSAIIVGSADTLVALLAGIAIFPVVFAAGLDPAGGPGLIFETLPIAFGAMPGGTFIGTLFFVLLFFAAFTSTLGMLEPIVSWVEENVPGGRFSVAFGVTAIVAVASVGPTLSFNEWADVRPLAFIPGLEDWGIFQALDFAVANLIIPVNILLMAIFAGWVMTGKAVQETLGLSDARFRLWRGLVRYLAPLSILAVLAFALQGGDV